jgi:HSP20 family protein
MTLFRVMPSFNSFFNEVNRLQRDLESTLGRNWPTVNSWSFPALNIWEDDESVFVSTELPGFQLKDLEVYVVNNDQLVLKGERKAEEHLNAVCHRQERMFGNFNRTVTLPTAVDADKVEAKLENGVLNLKLAKSPVAKPKKIVINTP